MLTLGFTFYLLIVTFLILFFAKNRETRGQFWLAKHSAGPLVSAFAAGASDMSSWLFLALPGAVYIWGSQDIYLCLGLIGGAFISWTYLAPRLVAALNQNPQASSFIQTLALTVFDGPDTQKVRKILTLMTIFFTAIYLAASLESIAKILSFAFQWTPQFGRVTAGMFLLFFGALGGARALNILELFQGTALLILLMLLCLWIGPALPKQEFSNLLWLPTPSSRLLYDLSWGLGYLAIPHILTRMSVITKEQDIPKARNILLVWMTLSLFSAFMIGYAARFQLPQLIDHETIIPQLLLNFSPFFTGLGLALMAGSCFCAGLAQLYSASSALAEDLFSPNYHRVWAITTVIFFAAVAAYSLQKDIFMLVNLGWAGLTSTFAPYLILMIKKHTIATFRASNLLIMNFILTVIFFFFELTPTLGTLLPCTIIHCLLVGYNARPAPLDKKL